MSNPTEWTALGVILVVFGSGGAWLFKTYLPQMRSDFLLGLEKQRVEFGETLKLITAQLESSLQSERDLHRQVQKDEGMAHRREVDETRVEILSLSKEIHALTIQQGKFIAIWITTQGMKTEQFDALMNLK